jgi:hypothetical protein
MNPEELRHKVEEVVRRSEVRAVVQALKAGECPQIGEVLSYTIDLSDAAHTGCNGCFSHPPQNGRPARLDTYQFPVEPWHLGEAARILFAEKRAQEKQRW